MSMGLSRRVDLLLRLALTGAVAVVLCSATSRAGVTTSLYQQDHVVTGSTAAQLVRSMNASPVRGDHGNAYASIHPNYTLSVETRERGGICRASVDVAIHFRLTLPKAANTGRMGRSTRSAWNGFVNFARNHEAHHRVSYTECARSFVVRAERMGDRQCFALSSDIRQMFAKMKRDCEAKQLAFDRSQARVLPGLSLFAMARHQRRH
ncbi:MAG: DUF922 domain-containing protein [Devosia nanyangense]|uniref:DUF922 domain-containing protein n=1 Tax=Devosia nanyangense TaxID=1228055 RepID=A0A933NWM9_9HYPH|nr:DUF922 domain-containing protein [Devosia nanyangense]